MAEDIEDIEEPAEVVDTEAVDKEAVDTEAVERDEPLPEKPFSARITPLERHIGYLAAALVGVAGAAQWAVQAVSDKDGRDAGVAAALLVAGLAIAAAVHNGRRIILLV